MAVFQTRVQTIGAKQFTGDNADEIAEFLSSPGNFVHPDSIRQMAPPSYWAVKTSGSPRWISDGEIKRNYRLTAQGADEHINPQVYQ